MNKTFALALIVVLIVLGATSDESCIHAQINVATSATLTVEPNLVQINDSTPPTSPVSNEGVWTEKAPMPTARLGLGVAAVDGKIYAIGGCSDTAFTVGTNEMYDPATDTWTTEAPMPTPSDDFGIAVYNNTIYCIGGSAGSNGAAVGVNQVYDPITNTWKEKTSMPTPQEGLDASVVDGKIYLICGDLNQVYDPASDTWSTATPPPTGVSYYASAVVDNKIYIFGGINNKSYPVNLTQIYDPQTDTWNSNPIPQIYSEAIGESAAATTGVIAPIRIYVIGGEGLIVGNQNLVYNPQNDSWSTAASMPTASNGPGIAVINDVLYVIGGGDGWAGIILDTNEQYTPIGYGTLNTSSSSPSPSLGSYSFPSSSASSFANSSALPNSSALGENAYWIIPVATTAIIAVATTIVLKKRYTHTINR